MLITGPLGGRKKKGRRRSRTCYRTCEKGGKLLLASWKERKKNPTCLHIVSLLVTSSWLFVKEKEKKEETRHCCMNTQYNPGVIGN